MGRVGSKSQKAKTATGIQGIAPANLWMGRPAVAINGDEKPMAISSWSRVTYDAMTGAYGARTRGHLRSWVAADPEVLIATAARAALQETDGLDLFVDCRSSPAVSVASPTYRASSLAGLIDVPPIAISGGGGTELALALLVLNGAMNAGSAQALVALTSQDVIDRRGSAALAYGTASAAVVVTNGQRPSSPMRVLAVVVVRRPPPSRQGLVARAVRDLRDLGVTPAIPRWSITTFRLSTFGTAIQQALPAVELLGRTGHGNVDYGCADVLVSLSELVRARRLPPGPGILWLAGHGREIAAVVVEAPDPEASA